jgi:PAS domain S-box-containing protein
MSDQNSSPYPGPRPFHPAERDLFFGRADDTGDLFSLITAHREILLYAQSGAGKTSLLNAGLVPVLKDNKFQVLPIARVGGGIPQNLVLKDIKNIFIFTTLSAWTRDHAKPRQLSLHQYLAELSRPRNEWRIPVLRILIFDQFEELFSSHLTRWKDRRPFLEQVAEAIARDPQLRVLFVMREEYIAQLEPYTALLPENLRTRFRLDRLDKQCGLQAIKGPMSQRGRSFAPGVAEKLLKTLLLTRVQVEDREISRTVEVAGEFVEPLQLQIVCQELWDLNAKQITFDRLSKIGSVDQVLSRFYDRAVRSAAQRGSIDERKLRAWSENALITLIGTRSLVYKNQWRKDGIPDGAINELEHTHLLRIKRRAGAYWYELVHDRFISPIRLSNKNFFVEQLESSDQTSKKAAHVDDVLRKSRLRPIGSRHVKVNSEDLLRALVQEIRKDIPFDLCIVSVLSRNMKEGRIVFLYPREEFVRKKRWYRVPEFLRTTEWSRRVNFVDDLPALVAQFNTPSSKSDAERFYNSGYISLLRYPVLSGGSVIATMSLLSKTVSYSDKHRKLLARITAVEKCLINVVYSEQTSELQFRLELLKKLFAITDNTRIAEMLPTDLAYHYRWETVAIFSVDKYSRMFSLVGQNSRGSGGHASDGRDDFYLPPEYIQPLDKGVLGVAFAENRDVKIDNIDADIRYRDIYVRSRNASKSELCMRIMVGGEIRWLLNIEDSQENAFSNEEKKTLRDLLDQVGALIERITTTNLISATFDATMTAVFVTDDRGLIRIANPSAAKMFGLKEQQLQGTWVGNYFADRPIADHLLATRRASPTEARMRTSAGREIRVLVSSSTLTTGSAGHVLSVQHLGLQS